MKYLKSPWKGYTQNKARQDQTEIESYEDGLSNTTQQTHDTSIAGKVDLGQVSFTFKEDASVMAIKQKCIDMEEISLLVIEDVLADKEATVLRRLTLHDVIIIGVTVSVDAAGAGMATVTVRCQQAKWERLTPDKAYAEAKWNPNNK